MRIVTNAISRSWFWVVALAAAYTLLNAGKPLLVDDAAYWYYAAQIAQQPLDPYGFAIFWYQRPLPANEVLAPPLLPSWWALGIALFGQVPFLWKLWLFPFVLLFVGSLHALLHRFARGMELPLLVMIVFSPTFLPSLNLMLDVPALALSLGAVAMFLSAAERRSWGRAGLAGLLAGLAMETKYTGFVAPAVMVLDTVVALTADRLGHRTTGWQQFGKRLGLCGVAVAVAVAFFVSCEALIAWRHGQSHFLCNLGSSSMALHEKIHLIRSAVTTLGGVAPLLAILALIALGVGKRWILLSAGLVALGYLLVVSVEPEWVLTLGPLAGASQSEQQVIGAVRLDHLVYGFFGLALGLVTAGAAWQLPRGSPGAGGSREDWFLILWLGLELAAHFALTPFPAVRRVMGLVVVETLLIGRLAARTCPGGLRLGLVRAAVAGNVALGFLFCAVDWHDAASEQKAVESAALWVRAQEEGPTIWYSGHWGFQFYAERSGLRPAIPWYQPETGPVPLPPPSILRRRDWLLVIDDRHERPDLDFKVPELEHVTDVRVEDAWPMRTVRAFYGGDTPLERHTGPRVTVAVYRVVRDFTPAILE